MGDQKVHPALLKTYILEPNPKSLRSARWNSLRKVSLTNPATFNDIKHADSILLPPLFFPNVLQNNPVHRRLIK